MCSQNTPIETGQREYTTACGTNSNTASITTALYRLLRDLLHRHLFVLCNTDILISLATPT